MIPSSKEAGVEEEGKQGTYSRLMPPIKKQHMYNWIIWFEEGKELHFTKRESTTFSLSCKTTSVKYKSDLVNILHI